ncbi:unnamed protein product [Pylaiella littoralis]
MESDCVVGSSCLLLLLMLLALKSLDRPAGIKSKRCQATPSLLFPKKNTTAAAAAAAAARDDVWEDGESGWSARERRSPLIDNGSGREPHRPPALRANDGGRRDEARRRSRQQRQRQRRRRRRRLDDPPEGEGGGGPQLADIEAHPHDEYDRLSQERVYLNGLVAASAASTGEQTCNIAFAKTHKTASTTMAMILVRYARRHDKKLASFGGNHVSEIPLREAVQQIEDSGERVDVMHYHYTISGSFQRHWAEAASMYEKIMQENERINFITIVRNPRMHYLSYYYYYVQPEVQLSVEHFLGSSRKDDRFQYQKKRLSNPLCSEFGIRNGKDLDEFIGVELPKFRLMLLTEEFDEGLMVMRRLLGWDMIDMTYAKMMKTTGGSRRWDGKELKDVPHWDDLPEWVHKKVDASIGMDRKLYQAAEDQYIKMKAAVAVDLEADLQEFEELQKVLDGYLQGNSSSEAMKWYSDRADPYRGGEPFRPFL